MIDLHLALCSYFQQDGLVSINFAARVLLGDTKSDMTEQGRFKSKKSSSRLNVTSVA